ncbi:PQQ-dependent sugar dehydrogenase [Nakamurella deserti]|uniref:PQQ-dependent sugar dehydrogenase n=1 Tax=Nakamurella deserti TaxID=2164074 RepID=UPI000DBE8F31|nr:PQQ-dependent sugar dehydrogenase [Nakamurella deserti]
MSRRPAVSRRLVALLAVTTFGVAACSSEGAAPASTPAGSTLGSTPAPPSAGTSAVAPATTAVTPASTTAAPATTVEPSAGSATPSTASVTGPVRPAGEPTDVVTGLDAPWSVVFVDDTPLVSERDTGLIRQVGGDGLREVGTVEGVAARGEGGLLGLAPYPADAPTMLYAYFTGADDNRIVRMPLTGDAAAGFGLGPAETVFEGIVKNSTHNGGRIAFGPDGMLYVTTGDAQQRDTPQDPDSVNGKILRLTPDGDVPADNPVAGNPMYSMGHRNPQGIAWDASGQLWAAEFGQNTWDELNRIEPGGNYGWPTHEGAVGVDGFVDPVQQWATGDASPSGVAIAGDTLFIANLRGERLRAVDLADPAASTELYDGTYGRLRDVTVAPDGTLWILTNNTDGRGEPTDGDDRVLGVPLAPG